MAAVKPVPLVVHPVGTVPEPPPHLDVTGSELWRSVLAEWVINDAGSLAVLEEACHARDTAERLRRQIAVDGDMIETGNGSSKLNPAIVAELQARSLTARLLDKLGVLNDGEKRKPGRPPKRGGF